MRPIDMSVIVTVYNIEDYIGECIESVLQEKRINIELILVDDASTDRSLEICREYERKDSRVKVIHNAVNAGITTSRNNGLREACGEYYYIMDGDDLVKQDGLYIMYNVCKENNLDMLEFSADVFYDEENMKTYADEDCYWRSVQCNQVMDGKQLFADLIHMREKVRWYAYLHCYRGECFRENNLYYVEGLRYADGSEFHLYLAAKRVMCINEALYLRRIRGNSQITNKPRIHYLESLIILLVEELKLWDKTEFSDYVNKGIEGYFLIRSREIVEMYQLFIGDDSETKLLNNHPMAKFFYNYGLKQIPICLDRFTEEELKLVRGAERIHVYGAGFYGGEVAKVLNYMSITNYDFIVTNKKGNPNYKEQKKVYAVDEVVIDNEKDLVIVAISAKYREEICNVLEKKNCNNYIVFEL